MVPKVTTGGPNPDFITAEAWQKIPWWGQLALLLVKEAGCGQEWVRVADRMAAQSPNRTLLRKVFLLLFRSLPFLVEKDAIQFAQLSRRMAGEAARFVCS